MQRDWNSSPQHSRPESEHSTREIEHRFTELEQKHLDSKEDRDHLFHTLEKHTDKLTLHERVLLGLLMAAATLLQDKFPVLVHALKALIGS